MSEPLRWEEREVEIKPERVERTATYEEILKDFDNPCLVRALVERCQALEARRDAEIREAQLPGNALYGAIFKALLPYFPDDGQALAWDVLPSTLAGLAKKAAAQQDPQPESDEAWMRRVYPQHSWTPDDGIPYAEWCRQARGLWEAEHTALKAEVERLRTPRKIVVTLDGREIAAAMAAGLPCAAHMHKWYEYDGSYYCYGCKTFMPDKAALVAFDPEVTP